MKITLIGAGSVVFAKNLISDILQFPELSRATISLMDIDPARVRVAHVMAERLVRKLGVKAKIESTTDRRKAVTGARYVICTIQVGGYKPGTIIDFEIPRRYGLLQTIGDTLGVGGVFRGLRTIPKVLEIARDIAEFAEPGCLFLNYTNPMAMLCMAVDHAVGIPTVGLCHSVQGTSLQLANYLGLNIQDITYRVAGINHMAFFLEFKYRGRDVYPLLFELLEDPNFRQDKVRFEMMRRLGYFVTESSEHQSEYTPYFIHHGEEMVKKFDIPIDEYLRRCESILATWKRTEASLIGKGDDITVDEQTHEYGSFIIHSKETNQPRVIYGNVPNTRLITNLPDRSCVEVPVLVDAQGLQPTVIGDLPPQLAAICRTNINVQELTVAAALTGKREYIYHAVMSDPHASATLPLDKIWAMCDDLIEAHQKAGLLGSYAPVIRNTGRSVAGTGDKVIVQLDPSEALTEVSGKPLTFTLKASNKGPKPYAGRIQIESSPVDVTVKGGALSVKIGAGKTVTKRIILRPSGPSDALHLQAVSADGRVLGRPYVFQKPRTVNLGKKRSCDLEVNFLSQPLLQGKLTGKDGVFELRGRVMDTDVAPDDLFPSSGSSIELFLRPATGVSSPRQWFLYPRNKGATVVDFFLVEEKRISFKVKIDKSGYDFVLRFDPLKLGIQNAPGEPFYMDLIVNAGALGEAHSACRVGWNGRTDGAVQTGHYALVLP